MGSMVELRKRCGAADPSFADRLGISLEDLRRYEAGEPIPRTVALAWAALARGIGPVSNRTRF